MRRLWLAFRMMSACRNVFAFAPGVRILCQEGFETLISFLFSQNNNVPRIKGIIERLCRSFGDPIGEGLYGFPPPERLAALSEEDLAPLRCGWRGAYVLDAACKVASGTVDLKTVAALPIGEARQALQTIKGVGPKVAECVLLYGLGRLEAFPLDVWMKRAMAQIFPRVYARKLWALCRRGPAGRFSLLSPPCRPNKGKRYSKARRLIPPVPTGKDAENPPGKLTRF